MFAGFRPQPCPDHAPLLAFTPPVCPPAAPQAFLLPTIAGVPSYKTWIQVKNNVLSLEIGKRMFYTGDSLVMLNAQLLMYIRLRWPDGAALRGC